MLAIQFSGGSHVGLRRRDNEDAYVVRPDLNFCAVADGMGGAAAGEEASRIFVETAEEVFSNTERISQDEGAQLVQKAFSWANERILDHVKRHPEHKGMGCTAELLAFFDSGFVLGHMGDSRTYRLRNGQFRQVSKDHSFVQDQLDQGLISQEEARNHRMRNIVLRAVGVKSELALDVIRGNVYAGDRFLLCSDGLTDMVQDADIEAVLVSGETLARQVDTLIELAKSGGGKDNVTVAIVHVS